MTLYDDKVELVAGRHKIEILPDDDAWASAVAHWNSGHGKKYDYDLGSLTSRAGEDGLCWKGEDVEICYERNGP